MRMSARENPAVRRFAQGALDSTSTHLGDHGIGGVRNDGAEDTCTVTGEEGDTELLELVVLGLWLAEGLVDRLDERLKRPELHDRVRDLSGPERGEGLVESTETFDSNKLGGSVDDTAGEGWDGSLGSDLDGFHL